MHLPGEISGDEQLVDRPGPAEAGASRRGNERQHAGLVAVCFELATELIECRQIHHARRWRIGLGAFSTRNDPPDQQREDYERS